MVISLLFCSYFFALSQGVGATVTGQRTRRLLLVAGVLETHTNTGGGER